MPIINYTDIAVIGSGFGGAIAASRLAESGYSVTVLERGPWRNTTPVNSMNIQNSRDLPVEKFSSLLKNAVASIVHGKYTSARGVSLNRGNGTYDFHINEGMLSVASSQVGGGSLVWGGAVKRPFDPSYWDNVAQGVSEKDMQPHFESIYSEWDVGQVNLFEDSPIEFAEDYIENGYFDFSVSSEQEIAHYLESQGNNATPSHGIERKPSAFKKSLSFGCNDGSKVSVDWKYIGESFPRGLKLVSGFEVTTLEKLDDGYRISGLEVNSGLKAEVRCKKLVLAAGTFNTVRLLYKSQSTGSINAMPGLGNGVGGNGDCAGLLVSAAAGDCQEETEGIALMGQANGGDENLLHALINFDMPAPKSRLLAKLLKPVMKSIFLASMGADKANGKFSWTGKTLSIDYDPASQTPYINGTDENQKFADTIGKKLIGFKRPLTAHLFGGAIVSDDSSQGVVNGYGEVHTNPGMYITDASAIPKAAGGPPTLNIAAWSSHVSSNIKLDKESENQNINDFASMLEDICEAPHPDKFDLLFKFLPSAGSEEQNLGPGRYSGLTLCSQPTLSSSGRLKKKLGHKLEFQIDSVDSTLEHLKPKRIPLGSASIANSWDGSGLVYEAALELGGQVSRMQLRAVPGTDYWLGSFHSHDKVSGWLLISRT